tara:strand:+ start:126 stop:503 length:378 start_codon:yes stop_codon:yes gene_type:complete
MGFSKTILIIAFVLLVISLVVIGLMIRSAVSNSQFPPEVSICPDWWTSEISGNDVLCISKNNNLGNGNCTSLPRAVDGVSSMTNSKFKGLGNTSMSNKCNLAKACGVTWDGITNTIDPDTGSPWC